MKLIPYLTGYAEIRVRGTRPEKFINICIRRDIPVWALTREADGSFLLCMPRRAYRIHAHSIARKSECRVRVLRRRGLQTLFHRARGRKALLISAVLLCALTFFLNSLVWSVEVLPGEHATREDVFRTEQLLMQNGVKTGVLLDSVHPREVSAALLAGQKDLCWVLVRREGTRLYVEIERGTFYDEARQIAPETPCDIIAEKDCEILKCTVYRGTAVCETGRVVCRGERLVAGLEAGVHAQADIMAKTWYQVRLEVIYEADVIRETGRTQTGRSLFLLGLNLPLPTENVFSGTKAKAGSSLRISENLSYWLLPGGIPLPLGIRTVTRTETELTHRVFDGDEALSYTRLRAADLLDEKIPDNAEILSTVWRLSEENGVCYYEITAECTEPVGIPSSS